MPTIPRVVSAALTALTALVALVALAPGSAHADSLRLQVDWIKTVEDAQAWLGASAMGSRPSLLAPAPPLAVESDETNPLTKLKPHVSLVGRDWNASFLLSGRLSALDSFRLSQDSRMVVARIGFGDGAVVPFAQLGFGQWRVDRNWLPLWVSDTEVATQIGAGMEVRLGGAYSLALESDYTVLYRDQRLPTNVPFPRMWGALSAARVRF